MINSHAPNKTRPSLPPSAVEREDLSAESTEGSESQERSEHVEHTGCDEDSLLPPEATLELSVSEHTEDGQARDALDHSFQEEARSNLEPLLGSPPLTPQPTSIQPKSLSSVTYSEGSASAPALGIEGVGVSSPAVSLTPAPHPPARREGDSGTDWLSTPAPSASPVSPVSPVITPPPATTTHPLTSVSTPITTVGSATPSQPPSPDTTSTSSAPPPSGPVSAEPSELEPEEGLTPALELTPNVRPLDERNRRKIEAFVQTLERARESHVLIVIKGHPDPDSLGSASAQQHCFKRFDIQSSILYFDEISHPENRALVKVIEMDLILYHEEFNFEVYDYLAFVDSQSADIPQANGQQLPPILTFVDHHKDLGRVEADFIDIRETYGSTSAIYAEYLEYYPAFSLQKSSSSDAHIATALMHGIRTDTDNLLLAGPNDFYAAGYLRSFNDRDLLRMVSKQSVSARTMEIIKQGLNNKVIKGTFLLAGVGFVREEDRDGIAQTADFLLRHEGVETAVVFGIVNNKLVDGSLRTSSATVDPDRWLKDLFGHDEHGKHYGGGRCNKGGFRIPLGLLAMSPDRKALWKLGEQTIHDLIFDKIGEKEKEGEPH